MNVRGRDHTHIFYLSRVELARVGSSAFCHGIHSFVLIRCGIKRASHVCSRHDHLHAVDLMSLSPATGNVSSISRPAHKPTHLTLNVNIPAPAAGVTLACPSNVDSGYASAAPPNLTPYPLRLELCRNWLEAANASERLPLELRYLEECETALRKATARGEAVGDVTQRFRKRRSSLSLKKRFMLLSPVVTSPGATTPATAIVDEWKARFEEAERAVAATRSVSGELDSRFDKLLHLLDESRPVTSVPTPGRSSDSHAGGPWCSSSDPMMRARKTVITRNETYMTHQTTAETVRVAFLALRSAHILYLRAQDTLSVVCDPNGSKWGSVFSCEESRHKTCLEAARLGEEAQARFDKCLAYLRPHRELFSEKKRSRRGTWRMWAYSRRRPFTG
ncbi:hypothetical protein BD413DRAFT_65775 [Trametes elegans]|nr:hypothetical protein BD413DRAFT_65775 [Trametes elegans]